MAQGTCPESAEPPWGQRALLHGRPSKGWMPPSTRKELSAWPHRRKGNNHLLQGAPSGKPRLWRSTWGRKPLGSPSSQPHPALPKTSVKETGAPLPGPGRLPVPTLGRASLSWLLFFPSPEKAAIQGWQLLGPTLGPPAAEHQVCKCSQRKKGPAVELISGEGLEKQERPPRWQPQETRPCQSEHSGKGESQRQKRAALRLGKKPRRRVPSQKV